VELEEGTLTSSIEGRRPLTEFVVTSWGHFERSEKSPHSIERVKVPLSNLPKITIILHGGVLRGIFSPLNWIGDSSQRRLGVTLFGKGETPFPTPPQSLKVVFRWSWRRVCSPPPILETPRRFTPRSDRRMVFGES